MDDRRADASTYPADISGRRVSVVDVVDALLDAALVFDRSGVVVAVNRACAQMLSRSVDDIHGCRTQDLLPAGLRAGHVHRRDEYLNDPRPQGMGSASTVLMQRLGGTTFPVEFSLAPLGSATGAGDGVQVLAVIREVVAAPSLGGDRHLALAERAARMGAWEEDGASGQIEWSTGMYDVLGVRPGDAVPGVTSFLERIHPDDLPLLQQRRAEARAAGGDFFVEARLKPAPAEAPRQGEEAPLATPVTISILGHVELDGAGRVRSSAGTVQDVSARLGHERQLHVSNARLQRAFDAAPIGMSLIDARPGRPADRLIANHALAEITGLTTDGLLDASLLDSIDSRDQPTVAAALAALCGGEVDAVRALQARVTRPDGEERWVNVTGALVRDRTGAPDYLIANMVDVSEQVRAEQATRAAQEVLRAALDASPDGFAVYRIVTDDVTPGPPDVPPGAGRGPRFVLTQINASAAATTTADGRPLVGLTLEEILDDAEASGIPGLLRRAVADPGTHRLRTAHATRSWAGVLDVVAVRVDEHHVLTTWRDVSSQVASENVLIEAYGRAQYAWDTLHLAMDAASDAIFVLEVDTTTPSTRADDATIIVRHLNTIAAAPTGLDRDALVDGDLAVALPEWQHTPLLVTIRTVAASGIPQTTRIVRDGPQGPNGAPAEAFEATVSRLADNRLIVISRDVTAHETTHRQIENRRRAAERAASRDPLTDLPNRATLEQRLRHALMTCGPDERVAVLFCDLDDFKTVNDTLGHRAGDLLLRSVAGRLEGCLRQGQTAARISGDEFVLVLPGLDPSWQPGAAMYRIRDAVQRPVDLEGADLTPTLTIGCHLANPATIGRDRDPADVLAAADKLMYDAKTAHRRPG